MSTEYLKLYLKLYFNKSDMEGAHATVSMESIQNPGQMFFPSLPFLLASFLIAGILIGSKYCKDPSAW